MARQAVAGSISAAQDKKIAPGIELPSAEGMLYEKRKPVPSWLQNLQSMSQGEMQQSFPQSEGGDKSWISWTDDVTGKQYARDDLSSDVPEGWTESDILRSELAGLPEDPGASGARLTGQDMLEDVRMEVERESVPSLRQRRSSDTPPNKWQFKPPKRSLQDSSSFDEPEGMMTRAKIMSRNDNNIGFTVAATPDKASDIGKIVHKLGAVVHKEPGDPGYNQDLSISGRVGLKTDPALLGIASLVVENDFTEMLLNEEDIETDPIKEVMGIKDHVYDKPYTLEAKRLRNNAKIGNRIFQEWQRTKGEGSIDPVVPDRSLPSGEAEALGLAMKQIWALNNPDIIEIIPGKPSAPRGNDLDQNAGYDQAQYRITDEGARRLNANKADRTKMFGKIEVEPSRIPVEGQLLGDTGVTQTKTVTGKNALIPVFNPKTNSFKVKDGEIVMKPIALGKELDQAIKNLSTVNQRVDKRRFKILLQTALPVLAMQTPSAAAQSAPAMAEINNIGPDKLRSFQAAYLAWKREADSAYEAGGMEGLKDYEKRKGKYNVEENLFKLQNKLAQELRSIAKNRNSDNYLTFYVQAFSGRLTPQQTLFNPVTSHAARFVTRNAVPTKVIPAKTGKLALKKGYVNGEAFNSAMDRKEEALIQMYALLLNDNFNGSPMKGLDSYLPDRRKQVIFQNADTLRRDGQRLKQALTMSDEQYEAVAEAITKGVPLDNKVYANIQPLIKDRPDSPGSGLDPVKDKVLIEKIAGKGSDGPHYIDALIDFANYMDAKDKGEAHLTYLNAYIDGKTNGLASNGMQMGHVATALRTGVLRKSLGTTELLDDGDIRDALRDQALASVKDGFAGPHTEYLRELNFLAEQVYSDRGLNKHTTMTFGYGKEIESFAKAISDVIDELVVDPEVGAETKLALDTILQKSVDVKDQHKLAKDLLLGKYGEQLFNVLSADAINARRLMRNAATIFAAMDENFIIKSHTGMDLSLGGWENTGEFDSVNVNIYQQERNEQGEFLLQKDGRPVANRVDAKSHTYKQRYTSAAKKTRVDELGNTQVMPGEFVYGGSLPSPIQSLDAATVAMTASGESWSRLKYYSGGNPYFLSIYDAFKMDVNGYDTMLKEVNSNWMEAANEWSYLREARRATAEARSRWEAKMSKANDEDTLSDSERVFMDYMLRMHESDGGGPMKPKDLSNRLKKLIFFKQSDYKEGSNFIISPKTHIKIREMTEELIAQMGKVGWDVNNPPKRGEAKVKHLKTFVDFLMKAQGYYEGAANSANTSIDAQFQKAISTAEMNKKLLLKEIIEAYSKKKVSDLSKESIKSLLKTIEEIGAPIYQYYAH